MAQAVQNLRLQRKLSIVYAKVGRTQIRRRVLSMTLQMQRNVPTETMVTLSLTKTERVCTHQSHPAKSQLIPLQEK